MTRFGRVLMAMGACLVIPPTAAWVATGRATFTYWPSAELAAMNSERSLEDALRLDPTPAVDNTFRFGLLPSPTITREGLSVLTLAAPGVVLALAGWRIERPGRRRECKEREQRVAEHR